MTGDNDSAAVVVFKKVQDEAFMIHETLPVPSALEFPESIDFELTTSYISIFEKIDYSHDIYFDLSGTHLMHSSFLGLILSMQKKFNCRGGRFYIRFSPVLKQFLSSLNILDYFINRN
jgi:anti-anti-sigma regulatory factor